MTQFINKKIIVASLFCAPFLLTACGDDITEEIVENEQVEEIRWTRPALQLVVDMPADEEGTRVTLVDNKVTGGRGVSQTWETTDNVGVWNATAATSGQNGYNIVHPNSNTKLTQFVGTVNCQKDDKIAMFYPYGGTGVTTDNSGTLTISLGNQKGTLEDIAKNFDLVYGEATVRSVSNGDAMASVGTMTTGIAIFEFQFQNSENNNAQIEFERVQIQIEGGHNTATLNLNNVGSGLTMLEPQGEVYDTIYVKPAAPATKVYVALFGESKGKTFHFSIIDKFGFQHKVSTKAPSSITAGQITRASLKSKKGDFIEFGGIKFAKGNLLWDNGPASQALGTGRILAESYLEYDSYFIAPSQEWSPYQLKDTRTTGIAKWPASAPIHQKGVDTIYTVPNPGADNYYYATFYLGIAGLHGATSAQARVVTKGSSTSTTGSTQLVVQRTFPTDEDYRGKLWDWSDVYLNTEIPLSVPLNWARGVTGNSKTQYFFGDLPYMVSKGKFAMPTVEDYRVVFEHPNICWGVVMVPGTSTTDMRDGTKNKHDRSLLPIYGLYVNKTKTREQMEASNGTYVGDEDNGKWIDNNKEIGYKGCAVVLTAKDLEEGIFLPADGICGGQSFSGTLNFSKGYVPGEYCSYSAATFGAGAIGSQNARHWTARAINRTSPKNFGDDNKADVKVEYKNAYRTNTGSIRPIFFGDIYK